MIKLGAAEIWEILADIYDPEIPPVSLVDLGIIRSVGIEPERVIVTMTPTFVGCPALRVMQSEIMTRLHEAGVENAEVRVVHAPPWSSDWITPQGRQRLKDFGLAPPPRHSGQVEAALAIPVACPYCESQETEIKNDFGSTLCRAIYVCTACRQPFEAFKPR